MANVDMPPFKSSESAQSVLTELPLESNEIRSASSTEREYSCDQFASKILQNLNCLRLNSKFCDVEIVAGDKILKAHRAVLSASSPYFQAMFTTGLAEEQLETVEIHSVDPHILQKLIDFIYTGVINVTQENVQGLMIAADMLELTEVVNSCTDFLKQELHLTNAIGIYRFAEGHNCESLATFALDFIHGHFPDVCKEEEFFELPKDQLIQFLSSEQLRVDTEFQVFQAAMRWIMHDVTQRRQFVFEILAYVRLPLLATCLLDRAIRDCRDASLKVALRSVRKDLVTKKGSLVPLYVYPRICAKKDIFVIGGSSRELVSSWTRSLEHTLESVERFDTYHRKWCRASPMGIGRILPGVATLNGLIFVVGGEQESQILANGECYNPRDDTWSKVASMIVPRCEFGLCALDGHLYAVGGWVGEDIGGSIEKYDPLQDEWTLEGSLPEPRFSMGVISYDGLIYIVGGCIHSSRHLQDLLSYNPVTREWTPLPSMLVPRSQMGVAVLDGYLYVVGGTNRNHEVLASVERYSFEENKWSKVPPMSIGRASPAVAAADGLLYVIGGDQTHEVNFYRAQITISIVECYNPLTEEWTDCPSLPESRSEAGAVVV
ncbi:actin-binding protein IPP [Anabrus simplex]|uniref:actin-binding protein IPP n=1 Tax=Anabrus simplex TaxID=316456 RepID=UPI0034DD8529